MRRPQEGQRASKEEDDELEGCICRRSHQVVYLQYVQLKINRDFPGIHLATLTKVVKNPPRNVGDMDFDPWSGNLDPTSHGSTKPA